MKETNVLLKRNELIEFAEAPVSYSEKMAVCNFGEHGTGKSRLGVTMPGRIGVIPLDRKTRGTIIRDRQIINPTKKILLPKEDFIRHAQPMQLAMMTPEKSIEYYRKHVNAIKNACWTLAECKDVQSIFIDSGSQLWEDILFANYGRNQKIMPRDRGSANQEMKDLLASLQDKHLMITHRAKEIWKNEKPSGVNDVAGFADMGYYVNVLAEHTRHPKSGEFHLSVRMCQANAALHGDAGKNLLTGDDITFQMLAMNVYPDSDPGDWE